MSTEKKDLTNGAWDQLYPKLIEYLEIKGITPNSAGFIHCINPNHPDRSPSCSINKGNELEGKVFHCFSCNSSGNLFHAVHFLDGKPISGPGFFEDTLVYLTKLFNIDYEPMAISDDVKREYQKRRAYQDTVNVIHNNMFKNGKLRDDHSAIKHLLDRGITESTIKKFKIGCIDGYKEYINDMKNIGWDDTNWLGSADLANKGLFKKDGIIIPIFDDKSRPVGFVTRTTTTKNDSPKFINSLNSDIYHKSEILFNFNNFSLEKGPIYIVEGYLDAVYLTQQGIENTVALGSAILTDEHIDLLLRSNVKTVYLILDGDAGGKKGTEIAIDRMSPYKNFNLKIVELPENRDPDDYVLEFGADQFKLMCRNDSIIPFEWTLKHVSFEDDPLAVAQKAIPIIAAEEKPISRSIMIKSLSSITNITQEDIKKEVELLLDKDSDVFISELSNINKTLQIQLSKRKIKDTKSLVEESLLRIKKLEDIHNKKIDNKADYIEKITEIRNKIETGSVVRGLSTPKFEKFDELIDGVPYWTNLILVGGRPSAGKTCLLTAIGIDIIDANEDAALFYMSIDDTAELMAYKIVAMKSGLPTSKIKKYGTLTKDEKILIDKAWVWLESHADRFIIADSSKGNSVDALESHIEWFVKNCPDKKRVFFLDNFHKLRVPSNKGKKSEAVADTSEKVKDLTQMYDIPIIMTVELRKLEGTDSRPTLGDLKDSVQLEYDADVILLVHNDYQAKKDKTNIVWQHNGKVMPYLEVSLEKNKLTGMTDRMAYKLNGINLQIAEEDYGVIRGKLETKSTTNRMIRI